MRRNTIIRLLVLLAIVGLCVLFVVQNQQAETVLGINLGVVAWRFSAPIPVAPLLLILVGSGIVLGLALGFSRTAQAQRRVRELERQQAFGTPKPFEQPPVSEETAEDGEEVDDWG
jgi:uncharacterized integral membrane protein